MRTCRHFKGDRPCKLYWTDKSYDCKICQHNKPHKGRILLIKLDALGDVLRCTPLAEGIKKKYPEAQLTWLTRENAAFFLQGNPFIDRIKIYNNETVRILQCEQFDIIINLDKDPKAASMAMLFNLVADKESEQTTLMWKPVMNTGFQELKRISRTGIGLAVALS